MDIILENIATISEISKIVSNIIVKEQMGIVQFLVTCIALILVVSIIEPYIIEALKVLITEKVILKKFLTLEWFCFIVAVILATIVYLVYILFYVVGLIVTPIDIIKYIVVGILFVILCGAGSQIGYDKILKPIKEIVKILSKSKK